MIIDSLIDLVRTNYSGYKRKKRIEVGAILVNSKTKQKWNVISIDEKDKDVILTLSLGDQKKEVKKKRENFLGFNEALDSKTKQKWNVISIDEKDKDVILTLSLGDQKKEVKKKRENFLGFNEALAELKDQLLEVISEW